MLTCWKRGNFEDSGIPANSLVQCQTYHPLPLLLCHCCFLKSTIQYTNLIDSWQWRKTCNVIQAAIKATKQDIQRFTYQEIQANKYSNPMMRQDFRINFVTERHRKPSKTPLIWIQAATAPTITLTPPNMLEMISDDNIVSRYVLYG